MAMAHQIICRLQTLLGAESYGTIMPKLETILDHINNTNNWVQRLRITLDMPSESTLLDLEAVLRGYLRVVGVC